MQTRARGVQAGPPPQTGRIVIVGGGIVGCATAYYLSELGAAPQTTVVERVGVASAASGKAGGFLAQDWSDGTRLAPLAHASFQLHKELAQKFGVDQVGYRSVRTLQVDATENAPSTKAKRQKVTPPWLDGDSIISTSTIATEQTTAQIHPHKLTTQLMQHAQQQGVNLVQGAVTGVEMQGNKVTGVHVEDQGTLPAEVVVIAMGPWSDVAARNWGLPLPRVQGQKAHSIVLTLPEGTPALSQCLFTNFEGKEEDSDPECYPRPDGTVYVCGEGDIPAYVDEDPEKVTCEHDRCQKLEAIAGRLSSLLKSSSVTAQQACNLPVGPDSLPIIGAVPGVEGAYVGTGHNCWGILNGPATGKALAELIVHGKSQIVDLKPYSPARFQDR